MTPKEILHILLTKSINTHYATRYIKFIFECLAKNRPDGSYTEIHHILPKAKTQFPEYKSLKMFPWNKAILTPREHFIAHWMLWKAQGRFMAYAFSMMRWNSSIQETRQFKLNSKSYEQLRIDITTNQSNRIISNETRQRMSKGQENRKEEICPHCGKTGKGPNMKKWHFDNCKMITGKSKHDTNQNYTIVTCPHCGKIGKLQGMYSNHFDNCQIVRGKYREIKETITCPHCNKIGKNSTSFSRYHLDNCPKLTGIKKVVCNNHDLTPAICPHCGKQGTMHGLKAKHFDNCKTLKPPSKQIICPYCGKIGNDNGYFKSFHINRCHLIKTK